VRRTAVAAGIEPLLARVVRADARRRAGEAESSEELFALRDELAARMSARQMQLLATEFDVDCVRGLIQDVTGDYEVAETDRQLALTIASLAAGTIASIGAASWDVANNHAESPAVPDGPLVVGVVGGLVTTGLGAAVLVPRPRAILFLHEKNLLTSIREGTDPQRAFSPSIFRLLTIPMSDGSPTPRDELVSSWDRELERLGRADGELAVELVFGAGGVYDIELLDAHQRMLQELGASLDALARNLDLLGRAVAELLRVSP